MKNSFNSLKTLNLTAASEPATLNFTFTGVIGARSKTHFNSQRVTTTSNVQSFAINYCLPMSTKNGQVGWNADMLAAMYHYGRIDDKTHEMGFYVYNMTDQDVELTGMQVRVTVFYKYY